MFLIIILRLNLSQILKHILQHNQLIISIKGEFKNYMLGRFNGHYLVFSKQKKILIKNFVKF